MTTFNKGSISLNLGIVRLNGSLSDEDRQCAWELYTELVTRVSVTGKQKDLDCKDFSGELYIESLESLYNFFTECRGIMRKFPVGRISDDKTDHLGVIINRTLTYAVRPFLERWQIKFRHWCEYESNKDLSPLERQNGFPELDSFIKEWSDLRWIMKQLQNTLVKTYKLTDVVIK